MAGTTRAVEGRERAVWLTARDDRIVRIANMEGVRWVLGGLNGWRRPVSLRQAQEWCTRMEAVGLVERLKQGGPGGSLVWATSAGTGRRVPHLFRQTTRHEVAVALTSARYFTGGFGWQSDEKPDGPWGHQADGVAVVGDYVGLIEVELMAKRRPRYATIFAAFNRRLDMGDGTEVVYLCTEDARRAVVDAMQNTPSGRILTGRIVVRAMFDRRGHWQAEELPYWLRPGFVSPGL